MVQGVAAFKRKFETLVPELVEERIRTAMERGATQLVNDMQVKAPVYAGPETHRSDGTAIIKGALKDSIGWTWGRPPSGAITLGDATTETGLKITIYAGDAKAFYARWVEFGTKKWTGSPFFFGTYRDHRRRLKGGITRALRKAIKEANNI